MVDDVHVPHSLALLLTDNYTPKATWLPVAPTGDTLSVTVSPTLRGALHADQVRMSGLSELVLPIEQQVTSGVCWSCLSPKERACGQSSHCCSMSQDSSAVVWVVSSLRTAGQTSEMSASKTRVM